jgi:hypothetical protein
LAGKLTSEEVHTVTQTGWKAYMDYAKFCGGYIVMAMLLLLVLLFTLSRLASGVWLQIWLDEGDGLEVSSEVVFVKFVSENKLWPSKLSGDETSVIL